MMATELPQPRHLEIRSPPHWPGGGVQDTDHENRVFIVEDIMPVTRLHRLFDSRRLRLFACRLRPAATGERLALPSPSASA